MSYDWYKREPMDSMGAPVDWFEVVDSVTRSQSPYYLDSRNFEGKGASGDPKSYDLVEWEYRWSLAFDNRDFPFQLAARTAALEVGFWRMKMGDELEPPRLEIFNDESLRVAAQTLIAKLQGLSSQERQTYLAPVMERMILLLGPSNDEMFAALGGEELRTRAGELSNLLVQQNPEFVRFNPVFGSPWSWRSEHERLVAQPSVGGFAKPASLLRVLETVINSSMVPKPPPVEDLSDVQPHELEAIRAYQSVPRPVRVVEGSSNKADSDSDLVDEANESLLAEFKRMATDLEDSISKSSRPPQVVRSSRTQRARWIAADLS